MSQERPTFRLFWPFSITPSQHLFLFGSIRSYVRRNVKSGFASRRAEEFPVFVAVDNEVLGFGSFSVFRPYEGFRNTVEHSVYVSEKSRGLGVEGRAFAYNTYRAGAYRWKARNRQSSELSGMRHHSLCIVHWALWGKGKNAAPRREMRASCSIWCYFKKNY